MATAGWQDEKFLHTVNNYLRYYGNIRVDSITHSGTNLRVTGALAFCGRNGTSGGGGFQTINYGVNATLNGSGGRVYKSGASSYTKTFRPGEDSYASFDTTYTNVSASTTSITVTATFTSCHNDACSVEYWHATASWTINFSSSASAPSQGTVYNIIPEWDRITGTISIGNWGGSTVDRQIELKILRAAYVAGVPARQNHFNGYSSPITTTVTNSSITISDPDWVIQGCGYYYTGLWAHNNIGDYRLQGPSTYTPPAPSFITYTDVTGIGTLTYPVQFVGDINNTASYYDPDYLTRYVRYKIDNGSWVVVENDSPKPVDSVSRFNISIPSGSTATVEGRMSYHGLDSVTTTITIYNGAPPAILYGSANGEAKRIRKLYGAVNGRAKKIKRLYVSEGGTAKLIYKDD